MIALLVWIGVTAAIVAPLMFLFAGALVVLVEILGRITDR